MDEASAVVRVVGVGVGECRAVGGDDPEQRRYAWPGAPVMYAVRDQDHTPCDQQTITGRCAAM